MAFKLPVQLIFNLWPTAAVYRTRTQTSPHETTAKQAKSGRGNASTGPTSQPFTDLTGHFQQLEDKPVARLDARLDVLVTSSVATALQETFRSLQEQAQGQQLASQDEHRSGFTLLDNMDEGHVVCEEQNSSVPGDTLRTHTD